MLVMVRFPWAPAMTWLGSLTATPLHRPEKRAPFSIVPATGVLTFNIALGARAIAQPHHQVHAGVGIGDLVRQPHRGLGEDSRAEPPM